MSGDHSAGEVEFYFLRNFELQAFALWRCFDNPKRVLLRTWGVDMEGFAKNGTRKSMKTNRMDKVWIIMEELFFEEI